MDIKYKFIYELKISAIIRFGQVHYTNFYKDYERYLPKIIDGLKTTEEPEIYLDIYPVEEQIDFIEYLHMFDTDFIVRELIELSQIDKVKSFLKRPMLDYLDKKTILSDSGILFFKEEIATTYYQTLKDIGIPLINVIDDFYIIDFSQLKILGTGANGVAIKHDDSVVKITINHSEFETSQKIEMQTDGFEDIYMFFPDIYGTYYIEPYLYVIHKEFVEGTTLKDDDELFLTNEYIDFESILEHNNLWLDIHSGNGFKNPEGKKVSFIYYDY